MLKKLVLSLLLSATIVPMVSAHSIWVNMTDWTPNYWDENTYSTRMYIGWGHRYPVDGLTNKDTFDKLYLIYPNNERKEFTIEKDGISTAEIKESTPGSYIIALTRKASVYTTYKEDGKTKRAYIDKDKVKKPIKSMRTQQFSTAHFHVGPKHKTDVKPLRAGNMIELVPLIDPYKEGLNLVGSTLPVQLLLDGEPVAYEQITATYGGFSSSDGMAQRLLTDENGIAHLRIVHWGPWLLKAKAERPATPENIKIADVEVYYTTLTLEIQ